MTDLLIYMYLPDLGPKLRPDSFSLFKYNINIILYITLYLLQINHYYYYYFHY